MSRLRHTGSVRPAPAPALAAAALLAVLLLPVMPPAAAAQTPAPPAEVFLDTVDVDVVNLEVSVTDRDGIPIHGLTREDFVVFEDGEEVELTNFYAVEAAQRVLPPEEAAADDRRFGGETAELPPDQRLSLAVVIDNMNISPPNRKRAIDQVRDELDRVVRPGDRVLVAVLDPLPRIEQLFTDDLDAVDAALERIGHELTGNLSLQAQRIEILRELDQGEGVTAPPPSTGSFQPEEKAQPEDYARVALSRIESFAEQAGFQMRRTFAGTEALVAALGGLPARKAVLFVSDGLNTNPALHLYEAFFQAYPREAPRLGVASPRSATRKWDFEDDMKRLTRTASANRVTFYTLDSQGARSAMGGPEFAGITPPAGLTDLSGQDTLIQLAAATGGSAMLNAANLRGLVDVIARDHSDYYSLGYVSPRSRDGAYHEIEVKVPGVPGARVRHTEGYRGKDARQEMADRTLSALVLDVAENPLDVRIELGREQSEQKDRYVLPVLVKVPISKLTLVPDESAHHGRITISVAVRGEDGGLSEPQHFEVPVDIPNEQLLNAMSREVGYGVNLLVRGGPGKLAVGVRDDVAAVESTLNLNIAVGG